MSAEEDVVAATAGLPLEARLSHTSWKVRADAYAAVARETAADSPLLQDFAPLAVRSLSDSNTNALDGAVEAVVALLTAPKTAARATAALLLLVELGAADAVTEAAVAGLGAKQPKSVAACADALLCALRAFGPRVVKPSPLMKACAPLLDHRDGGVRACAKELAVELTRWLGAAAVKRDVTSRMRDAQQKEVEEALEAVAGAPARPARALRSEGGSAAAAAAAAGAGGAGVEPAPAAAAAGGAARGGGGGGGVRTAEARRQAAAAADVWDVLAPVDILATLAKRGSGGAAPFYEAAVSDKWKERHAAFAELAALAGAPRLAGGDYGEVGRLLRRAVATDPNAAVVTAAADAAAALAAGLRREFRAEARALTGPCLAKLVDKSTAVGRSLRAALAAFAAHCYALGDAADDAAAALDAKAPPKAQAEAAAWLAAAGRRLEPAAAARLGRDLLPSLLRLAEASSPAVRDAALGCLAALGAACGSLAPLGRPLDALDAPKRARLHALLADAMGDGGGGGDGAGAPAEAAQQQPAAARPPSGGARPATAPAAPGAAARAAGRRPSGGGGGPGGARRAGGGGGASAAGPSAAAAAAAADWADHAEAALRGDEELSACAAEAVGAEALAQLRSPDWKARLAGAAALSAALAAAPRDALAPGRVDALLRTLAARPGWDDVNVQVGAAVWGAVALLARAHALSRRDAALALPSLAAALGDPRRRAAAGAAADALAACPPLGPAFVGAQLLRSAGAHVNPRVLEAALLWTAGAGLGPAPAAAPLGALLARALGSPHAGVRAAARALLGPAHARLGPHLGAAMGALPAAAAAALAAEAARCPYEGAAAAAAAAPPNHAPAAPAAATSAAAAAAAAALPCEADPAEAPGVGGGAAAVAPSTSDGPAAARPPAAAAAAAAPAASLPAALLRELGDADWKVRQRSLEGLGAAVASWPPGAATPSLLGPELVPGLRARLGDPNKMLCIAALGLVGRLAAALGPGAPAERALRPVFPELLRCWGDSKAAVRAAATGALDAVAGAQPPDRVVPHVAAAAQDAALPAEGRREALSWLLAQARAGALGGEGAAAQAAAAAGLADKAAQTRDLAHQLAAQLAAARAAAAAAQPARPPSRAASGVALPQQPPAQQQQQQRPATAPGAPLARGAAPEATAAAAAPPPAAAAAAAPPLPAAAAQTGGAAAPPAAPGPLLLPGPPERKAERLSRLPRKPAGGVAEGGGAVSAEARDAASAELCAAWAPHGRPDLLSRLFCDDFRRHAEACELLEGALAAPGGAGDAARVLDLLLRWAALRLTEPAPNTAALLRVLDWLAALHASLAGAGYALCDEECALLLPAALDRAGHNLPAVRDRFRRLVRAARGCVPPGRLAGALVGCAGATKNSRSRCDALDSLAALLAGDRALAERTAPKLLPLLAGLCGERDAAVRRAAAAALAAVHAELGEPLMWRNAPHGAQDALQPLLRRQLGLKPGAAAAAGAAAGGAAGAGPVGAGPAAAQPPPAAAPQHAAPPPAAPAAPAPARSRSPAPRPACAAAAAAQPATAAAGAGARAPPPPPPGAAPPACASAASPAAWSAALIALGGADEGARVGALKAVAAALRDAAPDPAAGARLAADGDRAVQLLTGACGAAFEAACGGGGGAGGGARGARHALNALMAAFCCPPVASAVAEPSLRAVCGELLGRLLDARVGALDEGPHLVRALNVLMLNLLDRADRTATFCALLLMLRGPPPAAAAPGAAPGGEAGRRLRFADLVVKCLVKLTRGLVAPLAGLDVSELLLTLHSFLLAAGVDDIARPEAEDDRPLRMVKTVLYELTRVLGPDIRAHLHKVPPPTFDPPPAIHALIALNLAALATAAQAEPVGAAAGGGQLTPETAGQAPAAVAPSPSPSPSPAAAPDPALQQEDRARLAAIFRLVGDKATTAAGLASLWAFTQEHPGVDIGPHLAKTSEAFRHYITRGLVKVGDAHRAAASSGAAPLAPSAAPQAPVVGEASRLAALRERMLVIRAQYQDGQ